MEKKTLEILVVEDSPKHMEDVKAEMQRRIDAGIPVKVDYAKDLKEARVYLWDKQYDGVICDVFFPSGLEKEDLDEQERIIDGVYELLEPLIEEPKDSGYGYQRQMDQYREIKDAMAAWKAWHGHAPLGVCVAEEFAGKLPLVFCTSTFHHGAKTEPVHKYAGQKKIAMIDSYVDGDGEAEKKEWSQAYQALIARIAISKIDKSELVKSQEAGRRSDEFKEAYEKVEAEFSEIVKPLSLSGDKYLSDERALADCLMPYL